MTTSQVRRGDVVLVRFPFTDLTGSSLRPAVVVSPGMIGRDVILAAISSVVRGAVSPTDCLIPIGHAEFAKTGLRVTSVIRLHKLVTVEEPVLVRRLGSIGPQLSVDVDRRLRIAVGLTAPRTWQPRFKET